MEQPSLTLRCASSDDLAPLAALNIQLIRDEGHRNPMNERELTDRMQNWLEGEYEASLFDRDNEIIGYALYREDGNVIYLRQFFINTEFRRQGLGREAFTLLTTHWKLKKQTVRLDVLSNNEKGIAFWRAIGFQNYCVTMEKAL